MLVVKITVLFILQKRKMIKKEKEKAGQFKDAIEA